MFCRIFSHCLDHCKNWYTYNSSIPGFVANKAHHNHTLFKSFPSEVKKVDITSLRDNAGRQISHRFFYSGEKRVQEVYVISTFGILVLALWQRTLSQEWLQSEMGKRLSSAINVVCLQSEQSRMQTCNKSPYTDFESDHHRMERYIVLLQQKISEQETVIKSYKACTSLTKSPSATSSPSPPADSFLLAQTQSSRGSTSAILASTEITPPDKKRQV